MAFLGGLAQAMGGGAGISSALQTASPLLLAMSAGLQSGNGAMSQMPMGLMLMQQQAKQKQEQAAKDAAAGAYGSWQGGTMASGVPAAMGASNTPPPSMGPLAGAMRAPERFSPAPSNARMDEMFAQTEQQYRLPAGYLARTAQIESGGNPNAQNPNSSAGGLFQFIDSTAAQYGVNKMDPASATEGAARLAADNAAHLRQALGREPSAGELYLAHQQGAGGAAKLLLNPNAKAADIVGTEAVRLNGGDPATWTAGDFARRWQGEYGETQIADPASDPQVQGMIGWLAQYGEVDPSRAAAVKMQLEMRIQQLQAQSEGQGITDAQAAQFGLQEAGQQNDGQMTPYQEAQLALERERMAVGNRGTYGLDPIRATDADGNPVLLQSKTTGGADPIQLPEGVTPTFGVEKIDGGDHWLLYDRQTGTLVGKQPKNVRAEASERAIGTAEGEIVGGAKAQVPGARLALDEITAKVGAIVDDPVLKEITGRFKGRLPEYLLSQKGQDLKARIDQLGGDAFLSARQMLKGGGTVTDYEGQKAEQALMRAGRAQSAPALTEALNDFRKHLENGLKILEEQAGGNVSGSAPASGGATRINTVEEYNALPSGTTYVDPNGKTKVKR
jgi:hypothetical protein